MLQVHCIHKRHGEMVTTMCGRFGHADKSASAGLYAFVSQSGKTHFQAVHRGCEGDTTPVVDCLTCLANLGAPVPSWRGGSDGEVWAEPLGYDSSPF